MSIFKSMLPSTIRKPSEWRSVKCTQVKKAVKQAQDDSIMQTPWSDVDGWSFDPSKIGNLSSSKKRRRLFTGNIRPSEFLEQAHTTREKQLVKIGVVLFILFDLVMIGLLLTYL